MLDGARVFHVNVNCRDLDRSRAFYEGLGLTAAVRTAPDDVQSGEAFGLERAQWDAWILTGPNGIATGGVIDLLEWKVPATDGAPPTSFHTQGFQRVGTLVPDLDAAMRAVAERGGRVWGSPSNTTQPLTGEEIRLVIVSDPDGVAVELVEAGGPSVTFVGVVCSDLARSVAFYSSIGFREVRRFPSANDDGSHLGIDGPSAFDEVLMMAPGGGISVMLVGFTTPAVSAAAPRPANAVGIWRTALLVPDLDAECDALATLGIDLMSPPVTMAMGSGLPKLRFVCFRGPDHEVIELIEQPT